MTVPGTFPFILLTSNDSIINTSILQLRKLSLREDKYLPKFPCSGGTWIWIQFCPPSGSKLLTTFLYVPLEPRNSSIILPSHTLDLGPRMYLEPSDYVGTRVDLGRPWPPLMGIIGRRRDGEKLFPNFHWLSEWHQPSANTGPRMGTPSHIPGLFFEQLGKQTHFC